MDGFPAEWRRASVDRDSETVAYDQLQNGVHYLRKIDRARFFHFGVLPRQSSHDCLPLHELHLYGHPDRSRAGSADWHAPLLHVVLWYEFCKVGCEVVSRYATYA